MGSDIKIFSDRVSSYVQEIHKKIPPEAPEILYHYTDGPGLKGILENRTLWLTDIFSMNDPSEIRHGVEIARKQLAEVFKNGLGEEKAKALATPFFKPALEQIKITANYFICCFSSTGDDLGQWRAYADDGHGYALGFEGKSLDKIFIADDTEHNNSFIVNYEEADLNEWQKELANIFLKCLSARSEKKIERDDWMTYMMALLMLSFLHKHWGYKNESEYRFLQIFPNDKNPISGLKHRLRSNKKREHSLAAYREFSWAKEGTGILKEIIIGPAVNFEIAKAFAEDCLKAYGYNLADVKIKVSDIPYRS